MLIIILTLKINKNTRMKPPPYPLLWIYKWLSKT